MYGTSITIVGNVVDEVVNKPTQNGLSRASFRVASTQRRKDRETGQWMDGHKFFVSVICASCRHWVSVNGPSLTS